MAENTIGGLDGIVEAKIGDLSTAPQLDDDALLAVEIQGKAYHVTGAQLKALARAGVSEYVEAAQTAAQNALTAAQQAQDAVASVQDAAAQAAAAEAANEAAQAAMQAAEAAQKAAEAAAELAAQQAAENVTDELAGYVSDAQTAKSDALSAKESAEAAAGNAAANAVSEAGTALAGYVADAQAAQAAAEAARDQAQSIAGGNYLPLAGGTLTGPLVLAGAPTADLQASTKKYVDDTVGDKQDTLTGAEGQVVGFDADGKPVAQAGLFAKAVEAGYTGTEAEFYAALVTLQDGPFLPLTGGTLTNHASMGLEPDSCGVACTGYNENTRAIFCWEALNAVSTDNIVMGVCIRPAFWFYYTKDGVRSDVTLKYIGSPTQDNDAANKAYVDAQKPKAVPVTLTAAGWDADTKTQTVAVAGVLADGSQQLVTPYPADDASYQAYGAANVRCFAWAEDSITFTCDTVPTEDINLIIKLEATA